MSETDVITVGEALPLVGGVAPAGAYSVSVTWSEGRRRGLTDVVDLAPHILSFRMYRPLRENEALFNTVHISADGAAIAWGADDSIDMASATVERLAEEVMTNDDFSAFLAANNLTFDSAAAQLGLSRRTIAYYTKARRVPRCVVLACKYIENRAAIQTQVERSGLKRSPRVGSADTIHVRAHYP